MDFPKVNQLFHIDDNLHTPIHLNQLNDWLYPVIRSQFYIIPFFV